MNFRSHLVGTYLGNILNRCHHVINARQFLGRNPEQAGTWAQDTIAEVILPHLCSPTGVFIDCGAHIGSVIALVERYNAKAKLFAVEAIPDKAAWLAKKFPKVTVLNFASGDSDCDVTFYVNPTQSGYSSLTKPNGNTSIPITVRMKCLDDLIPSDAAVDTIKIDVEGAELRVLLGAPHLIARCRPSIMFESATQMTETETGREDLHSIFDWFNEHGYQIYVPNRVAHNGYPLSKDGFIESHFYPRRSTNYFALPEERRDEIRNRARKALSI